ncbi:MAG: ABC transporter substrate-binding protein [Fimbriimonadaceae bacterium]|nr:ABC transporter substrate-binding protein [Fimbriimonadaceae bacterium]
MKRRSFLYIALGAVFGAGILAGCSGGGSSESGGGTGTTATGDTIKIGLVASLNGDQRPWGVDSERGVRLLVDQINEAGGVNGKKIELLVGDSNSDPQIGKSATEKLISDGAVVVLGEVASGITAQMAIACTEKGIPLVAIGATRDDISDKGPDIFRVCYRDSFQGPVMAKFAFEELGLKRVALMTDKKIPYSTGLSNSFRDYYTMLGGEIVDEQFYEGGSSTQFNAQLTNLKGKNPDGVFLSGYFTEVGPIVRQASQVGLTNVKFMGGDGWDSKEIINSGGEAIVGGYFCNHYSDQEDRPEVKAFLDAFVAKYNERPGTTMGALAYDAAAVAVEAIKAVTGDVSSKAVAGALHNLENFKGVSGDITFKGQGGNPPKRALVVELQADGTQKPVKAYAPTDVK